MYSIKHVDYASHMAYSRPYQQQSTYTLFTIILRGIDAMRGVSYGKTKDFGVYPKFLLSEPVAVPIISDKRELDIF